MSQTQIPLQGTRFPELLTRIATELHKVRRDLALYETAVLSRLEAAGHDVAPELQSIDLSLQTLEELASFVDVLADSARQSSTHAAHPIQMAFKLEEVGRRMMGLETSSPETAEPTQIVLF